MQNDIRTWMQLVEQQTHWPMRVTPQQLVKLISWDDVSEDDIPFHMMKFTEFDLRMLPVAQMKADWKLRNPENVEAYAQRIREGEMPPPVVYDLPSDVLIDGAHRLAAAKLAGVETLLAYVGTEDHFDLDWEDLD